MLDQVVRRWFARPTGVQLYGTWSITNYERYIGLLEGWGRKLTIPSDHVEEIIFEPQAARDRRRPTWSGIDVDRDHLGEGIDASMNCA